MTITGVELPSIPDILVDDPSLRNILLAFKQIAEIREGRRGDVNQRFITYYELIDYLAGNDKITVEAVTGGHNHDTLYYRQTVLYTRTESDALFLKITDAEGQYALIMHSHGEYSVVGHGHEDLESMLALKVHDHDDLYVPLGPSPWRHIVANGVTLSVMTSSDTVTDLQQNNDGNYFTATEIAGNAGQNFVVDFSGVIHFSQLQILARYQGSTGHGMVIQLEVSPFDGSTWHTYDLLQDQTADVAMENHTIFICNCTNYINAGVVKVRFIHISSGITGHETVVDEVGLYYH